MPPRVKKKGPDARTLKLRRRKQRAALTGEERRQWLARHAAYQRQRRARLPPERQQQLRRENAERNRRRRAKLTSEELARERKDNRERARRRRDVIKADAAEAAQAVAGSSDLFTSVGLLPASPPPPKKRREGRRPDADTLLLSSVDVEITESAEEVKLEPSSPEGPAPAANGEDES